MDHASNRKTLPFFMKMQTSIGSTFGLDCRDRAGSTYLTNMGQIVKLSIYCRVPARWGLQQTHPGLRAATRHGVRDPLVRSTPNLTILADNDLQKILIEKQTAHLIRFLLRQGEPGTSQYQTRIQG